MIFFKIDRCDIARIGCPTYKDTMMIVSTMTISHMFRFACRPRLCLFTAQPLLIKVRKCLHKQSFKFPFRTLFRNIIMYSLHFPVPTLDIILLPDLHIAINFLPDRTSSPMQGNQIINRKHDFIFVADTHLTTVKKHPHHKRIPITIVCNQFILHIFHKPVI